MGEIIIDGVNFGNFAVIGSLNGFVFYFGIFGDAEFFDKFLKTVSVIFIYFERRDGRKRSISAIKKFFGKVVLIIFA